MSSIERQREQERATAAAAERKAAESAARAAGTVGRVTVSVLIGVR